MIKQFTAGDITVRPFNTFKHWTLQSIDSSSVDTYGDGTYYKNKMEVNIGVRLNTPFFPSQSQYFNPAVEPINSSGQYARTVYNLTDSMFYKYSGEPMKQFGVEYYTEDPKTGKKEVRNINDRVIAAKLKKNVWGDKIVPNTLRIVDYSNIHNALVIQDDGYTNLYASGAQFPENEHLQANKTWIATPYWVTSSGNFYVTFRNGTTQSVDLTNARQYMAMGLPVTYIEPETGVWDWDTSTARDYFEPQNEHYGESVSSWGPYVAVGSSMDHNNMADFAVGYASLYRIDSNTDRHRLLKKFHFPFTQSNSGELFVDSFGHSISVRNNALAIGSPTGEACSSSIYPGYVCVYDKNKGGSDNWGIVDILKGDSDKEKFGHSVAIDDDILAVGAPACSGSKGFVYIFRKKRYMDEENPCMSIDTGSSWMHIVSAEEFCTELTGSTVVTQSYTPTFVSGNFAWVHEATLSSSIAASGDRFGWSLSLDSDVLLVGTNKLGKGYAALFTCSYFSASVSACPTASWKQVQLFSADSSYGDLNIGSPEYSVDVSDTIVSDNFGYSVSTSGKNILIGCLADKAFNPYYGYTGSALTLGAAYFYSYGYVADCLGYQYSLKTKTFGNRECQIDNNFGRSVSLDGLTAAVSSLPSKLSRGFSYSGSQYILENFSYQSTGSNDSVLGRVGIYRFNQSNDSWVRTGELKRNKESGKPYNLYGYSVSVGSDYMCVGAPIVNLYPGSCKYYTVETVTSAGNVVMDVRYKDCGGTPATYSYSQAISGGATPFVYTVCAQTGSVNVVLGKSLKAHYFCDPEYLQAIDSGNQTSSMASSYSGSAFVYDLNKYEENPRIGNVFYKNGYLTITHTGSNYGNVLMGTGSRGFELTYRGSHTIFENEYLISVRPGEFNYSTNPTALNQNSLLFDINGDGKVDYKDVDLVMRYLQYKKFYSELVFDDNGLVLEQDTLLDYSWWANDILQTESEDVLLQESELPAAANSASFSPFTRAAFDYIEKNLVSPGILDIDGNGRIDINDGFIFGLYVLGSLNPTTLQPYLTTESSRIYVKDIEDYLNPYCGNDPFRVSPHFLEYQYSSSYDATGSYLAPFITTIGLYANNELVAVGKLGRPIKNLIDWPVNIVVRFDT